MLPTRSAAGTLAALAVAEQILTLSPAIPTTITTHSTKQAAAQSSVEAYFHQSAEGVASLAQALGTAAKTTPFRPGDPRPYVEMDAVVAGVPVKAWALLDIPGPAVAMPEPYACAWCGISLPHGIQHGVGVGGHGWVRPSDAQILARMKARRAARRGGADRG
ncbi:hypothetical protein SRIMM317S_03407 [Streptomyces rimosus subsp. rimosus]